MTPRPSIRPSSTRPQLPISVQGETYRALPSPSSTSPQSAQSDSRSISGTDRPKDNPPPRQAQRHETTPYSASYRHRIWEDDRHSRSLSITPRSTSGMISPAATLHPHTPHQDGYFTGTAKNDAQYGYSTPHPSQVIPLSEAPRNPGGGKKQQSGRKRTACDRCKRQKSSCVEAYIEDPLTGMRKPDTKEPRCQRCVERKQKDCTITNDEISYARPSSPKPHSQLMTTTPTLPASLLQENTSPSITKTHTSDDAGKIVIAGPAPLGVSPGSDAPSQASAASNFWKTLFEEDASIKVKRVREDSPEGEPKQQGSIYFGNSHMGPSFVQDFVNASKDQTDLSAQTVHPPRVRRPDYRAEKLLKKLPGNEKEMDRYVDRFFDKYNFWADVIDEPDFRAMYQSFKHDHMSGAKADRASADLRDLSLIFMALAFGVVLDHTPLEEVNKQNQSILASIPEGPLRDRARECLATKDASSMTLNRREEMSAFWASLARTSLVDAQSASVGETINSISAWVLVAWYAIHGRQAEEGWSVLGQAARQAMASGFHIDGSHRMYQPSDITGKEKEQRRRVWAHMVIIDTSVSLYLGRPHAIFGGQRYTSQEPANIAGIELIDPPPVNDQLVDDAADRPPWQLNFAVYPDGVRGHPLSNPTRSTFLILHLRLAYIIGRMQLRCFGLKARKHEKDVVECEAMFEAWAQALPPHFKMQGTDHSLDTKPGYGWLKHQRKNLHSKYYIARISLHRPYLLAAEGPAGEDGGKLYESSKDACMLSAMADLHLRTQTDEADPLDRFKWVTVASGFNPALIMGIVCFFNAQHHKYQVQELLGLLSKYLKVESRTLRTGPVLQEELRALKFLYKSARVHIKLEQGVVVDGAEKVGDKEIRNEDGEGTERGRKRARYNLPFTTNVPLDMSVDRSANSGKDDTSDPIPLPPAHIRQTPTMKVTTGNNPLNVHDTSVYVNGYSNGNGLGMTYSHSPHPFGNVPPEIQTAIGDFAFGDQDHKTFADFSLPFFASNQGQRLTYDPAMTQITNNMNTNGIAPTPSPNTEANVWAAMNSLTNSSVTTIITPRDQVLINFHNASAGLDYSPPNSIGDLPGSTNQNLQMQNYDYGLPTGLGIQLGHLPTPMHGGTYYNPIMSHPQPHIFAQQGQQQIQAAASQIQTQAQMPSQVQAQVMRRQSYPQPAGQGQGWGQNVLAQDGLLPQTQDGVKVQQRSNSMWDISGEGKEL